MIARGYIRVSTDEQAKNGASIPSQEKILRALAVVKGYDDFEVYIDDGFSGKNLRRPRVQQLLQECRTGRVEAVLVWKLDRLSRSLRDLLNLIEEDFTPNGVTLISATESIDTSTPGGRAMLAVLGTFAQFEREQDAERVTMVHRQLAKDCRYLGGPVPLGYKIVDKHYQIDEATAPVVRRLFEMYLAHQGYTEMLRYLNGVGLKTVTGKPFSKANLNYILSNEKYVGTYIHNRLAAADHEGKRSSSRLKPEAEQIRIPGGIPAIISQATWDEACRLRAENRAFKGTYTSTPFLLAGHCHCAVCGSALRVLSGGTDRDGTRQRYYFCPNRCIPSVRKEKLEDAAFDAVAHATLDEELLIRACDVANGFLAAQDEDAAADARRIRQRMTEITKRQANITDALAASGAAAPACLLQELASLDADKAALAAQLTQLQRRGPHYDPQTVLRQLNTVSQAKEKPPEQQKSLLQAAIRDVIINQGEYSFVLTADESVELRGVEPLSESSKAKPSPSAVYDLTFPPPRVHRQTRGFSSFILQTGRKA